jgi:signal peptidase I
MLKRIAGVAGGTCTVLGDRPEESTDSRAFGPVPLANVLGRALFRYGPIGRIGWIW